MVLSQSIFNQENNSWETDSKLNLKKKKIKKNVNAPGDDGMFYILIKKLP